MSEPMSNFTPRAQQVLALARKENVRVEPMNIGVFKCAGISKVVFDGTPR
jgi:hypothetical protein